MIMNECSESVLCSCKYQKTIEFLVQQGEWKCVLLNTANTLLLSYSVASTARAIHIYCNTQNGMFYLVVSQFSLYTSDQKSVLYTHY